ncbi:MAG: crotonase/enoyl-CoA hydratase family protein [Myxococcales bacterium]
MSESPVSYRSQAGVATITMDDGKRNALSPRMFEELSKAFDQAEREDAIVILTGREEVFSAGFDLKVLRAGNLSSLALMRAGFLFAARMLGHPRPVISACNGHALAMGAFLLLASDYRIGTEGAYKFATNEVAIGIPMPRSGVELCRQRLAPAHFHRAAILAETFNPQGAVEAGFIDRLVPASELQGAAQAMAGELAKLDRDAHAITKLRIREHSIETIRTGVLLDLRDFAMMGAKAMLNAKLRPSNASRKA